MSRQRWHWVAVILLFLTMIMVGAELWGVKVTGWRWLAGWMFIWTGMLGANAAMERLMDGKP